ncbi:MAG: hypothetical protein WC865_02810 [Bacteroidales bacterium]
MDKILSYWLVCLILTAIHGAGCSASGQVSPNNPSLIWQSEDTSTDTHVAFRGIFSLAGDGLADIQLSGASWYVVWLDGEYFYEGPDRYTSAYPEYQSKKVTLSKGDHLIAVQVHYEGIETRILKVIQPFLLCRLLLQDNEIPIIWKCEQLNGFERTNFRINAELGWVEWVDTRKLPENWQTINFDDSKWKIPVEVKRDLGAFSRSKIGNVKALEIIPKVIAEGKLAEIYGYEKDNPSARFFLRDLACDKLPPQGVWKRYDLGRVRLARPKFVMDLPEGAVVEFAYSESLSHGRVAPWITLSASDSYNLDHFVARGGRQEFFPVHPKGGRFVEVHILAPVTEIKFVEEKFIERTYYDQPKGDFRCNDELLNKIWRTGIETYKACSEDALIDNPTRERGQWLGDMGVGMRIGAAGFSDISICRRGLVQSAQCARNDGMLAGFIPAAYQPEAVAYIKKHILNCFPNNPSAPRLSDPAANNPQLITPYFSHFAFEVLIEQGEINFVLDQYRKCWGWALEDDRTTWIEVFDTRWSNCHQWAGSPTWQLSTVESNMRSKPLNR